MVAASLIAIFMIRGKKADLLPSGDHAPAVHVG